MIPLLRVEDLFLRVNSKSIINGLNLQVDKGEIHGVLGENGTGKTTLAYLIMGTNGSRPSEGKILFEGEDISGLSVSERAKLGISLAWQEPARIEGLSVRDYLSLSGGYKLGSERINSCLRMVGMEPERYLNRDIDTTLSGGERKRIELASVIAMQPKLAILDEPDSGIDIVSLPILINGMKELNRQGSSILLITHSEEMVEIAHRVSVLCAGQILQTGLPAEMSLWFKQNCESCLHINEPAYENLNKLIEKGTDS
ncbi:ABC transporter ATP-binding protein [Chloroflexota bacterium]